MIEDPPRVFLLVMWQTPVLFQSVLPLTQLRSTWVWREDLHRSGSFICERLHFKLSEGFLIPSVHFMVTLSTHLKCCLSTMWDLKNEKHMRISRNWWMTKEYYKYMWGVFMYPVKLHRNCSYCRKCVVCNNMDYLWGRGRTWTEQNGRQGIKEEGTYSRWNNVWSEHAPPPFFKDQLCQDIPIFVCLPEAC